MGHRCRFAGQFVSPTLGVFYGTNGVATLAQGADIAGHGRPGDTQGGRKRAARVPSAADQAKYPAQSFLNVSVALVAHVDALCLPEIVNHPVMHQSRTDVQFFRKRGAAMPVLAERARPQRTGGGI